MNYLDFCTSMEKAALKSFAKEIRGNFLKQLPGSVSEEILIRHFSGSYSKFYWYTSEIENEERPLDASAIQLLRNVGEHLDLEINTEAKQGLSLKAAIAILKDLPERRSSRSNTSRIPVLTTRIR